MKKLTLILAIVLLSAFNLNIALAQTKAAPQVTPTPVPFDFNLVIAGDSNSAASFPGSNRIDYEKIYSVKYHDVTGVDVHNSAIGGYTAKETLRLYHTLIGNHYIEGEDNRLFIMVGVNDITAGDSITNITGYIDWVVESAEYQGYTVYVGTYPPVYYSTTVNNSINQLNTVLMSAGYNIIDINGMIKTAVQHANNNPLAYYSSDLLHLNAAGHNLIATKLTLVIN